MAGNQTSLERAFALARSGQYKRASEIREQLKREGLDPKQVSGPVLMRELRRLWQEARQAPDG